MSLKMDGIANRNKNWASDNDKHVINLCMLKRSSNKLCSYAR